jgi:hypothetical protein
MNLTVDHQPFFDFLDRFLDGEIRERWRFIVSKGLNRWKKLDPYDLWTRSESGRKSSHLYRGEKFDSVLAEYKLEALSAKTVYVACFGHIPAAFFECALKEALLGKYCPLEGLVFVKPQELVFCFTHEGEIRVFQSPSFSG